MPDLNSVEEWRPVPGYEGLYEVSFDGEIRSLDRVTVSKVGISRKFHGKTLAPREDADGYLEVNLYRGSKGKTAKVHRVVCEAFHGVPSEGEVSLHYDDDPANNRADNLRWGTMSDNMYDMVRNGNHLVANQVLCRRKIHPLGGENSFRHAKDKGIRSNCRVCSNVRSWMRHHPEDLPFESDVMRKYEVRHFGENFVRPSP